MATLRCTVAALLSEASTSPSTPGRRRVGCELAENGGRDVRRLLALVLGVLGMIWLSGAPAQADTLAGCLAKHHVCVTSAGRSLISQSQQDQLEQAIGNDDIYLVVAASGSSGYDSAPRQVISTLGGEKKQFVVGFLDSRLKHFGADNQGVL